MTTKPEIAVSAALFRDEDIVLVERSAGQSLAGLLSLPGGRVAFGESLRHAVAREVYEETGLWIDPSAFTFVTNHEAIHDDFHFVIGVFAAGLSDDAVPLAASDAAAVRLTTRSSLAALEEDGRTTPKLSEIVELAQRVQR